MSLDRLKPSINTREISEKVKVKVRKTLGFFFLLHCILCVNKYFLVRSNDPPYRMYPLESGACARACMYLATCICFIARHDEKCYSRIKLISVVGNK